VTLGTENKNKVIAVGVLMALAVIIVVWQFWPSSTTSAAVSTPLARPAQPTGGKKGAQVLSTIDPTLRTDLLKDSEGTKYEGNGKNIFVAGAEPIPQPIAPAVIKQPEVVQTGPPTPPPPPPIPLKFYGFATQSGGQKKVFLAENDDIFIAGEGDIVDRRYKVIHIYPMAVEIEDVLSNNRQQIPLSQS
jgi:ribosome-associated protein YbcJ (S4-like RNA binding protein)